LSLFVIGMGWRGRMGRINRVEGLILLAIYAGYIATLASGL
jgi:cation:H+ antiporter